jgi:hypothetical protein
MEIATPSGRGCRHNRQDDGVTQGAEFPLPASIACYRNVRTVHWEENNSEIV